MRQEKYEIALEMIRLALDRVNRQDATHRMELEEMKQVIVEARDARAALESREKPHFSKLPVELISEIFSFATKMDIAVPLLVSHVCLRWRSIVLSMPAIWQSVVLSNVRPVRKIELWLERSKNHIFDLKICADISKIQLRDALAKCGPDFFKTLKYIHSDVEMHSLSSCLLNIPNVLDLDLDVIQLSPPSRNQVDRTTAPLDPLFPLNRMSNARSLIVEYITVDWSNVIPALSRLHTLIIRTSFELPTTPLICALLKRNPQMEKMILQSGSPSDLTEVVLNDRIDLPCLCHLELLGPMDATGLISRLSLPALERLVISQSLSVVDQTLLTLEPFVPPLTELSVRKCSFAAQRLASFLRRMSTLIKLEITHSGSPMDSVVDAVAAGSQASNETELVCPRLQYVDFSHSPNLNGGPIVRLVKPRLVDPAAVTTSAMSPTPPPARIQFVRIDGCPRIEPAVPEWLRRNVDMVSCIYMTKNEVRKMRR